MSRASRRERAEGEPVALRQLFGVLPDEKCSASPVARSASRAWDRDHRFCGRCGGETERSTTERVANLRAMQARRVSATVARRDHARRARRQGAARPQRAVLRTPFYSTLAGFVEVGETLEETVAREVAEEAGVAVDNIRYFGSQPWPFTGSLMIGFTAKWASGEIVADPTEIARRRLVRSRRATAGARRSCRSRAR